MGNKRMEELPQWDLYRIVFLFSNLQTVLINLFSSHWLQELGRVGLPIKFDSSKKAFIEEQLASQTLSQQSPPQELEYFEEKEKRDV